MICFLFLKLSFSSPGEKKLMFHVVRLSRKAGEFKVKVEEAKKVLEQE